MPMPMEDISNCMMRVTRDLRTLQEQLRAFQHCDTSTQDRVLNDLLGLGLIQDLKSAVDQMRNVLWSYVDSAALDCDSKGPSGQRTRNHYLPEITAMLRLLHGSQPGPLSFVEQVTRSVDGLMGKTDGLMEKSNDPQQRTDNRTLSDRDQALGTGCENGKRRCA